MLRTFNTHNVRTQIDLGDSLWNFKALEGEHKDENFKLFVPSCWELNPNFLKYRGKAVYTKTIKASGDVKLIFKGVSHTANVYVDGVFVKTHYNAFTPFDVVVKDLADGEHELKVEVDNSFSEESVLHIENDYMTYGGITRGVAMEFLPKLHIERIHFTPFTKDGKWCGDVKVMLENISDGDIKATVDFTLNGKEYSLGEVVASAGKSTVEKTFEFEGVNEWSMEEPNLYLLDAKLTVAGKVTDDLIERVGFREVKLDGKKILINGRQIRIKGFNRHEDHASYGCAIPLCIMSKDIVQMKDMGANSVRTCHYPNDELFLDLCDETGMLVWEEHHARGFDEEHMRLPNFEVQCETCIEEMIYEHYNHPAIYIWAILNECASQTEFGASCYKKQLELINSLDKSRPNTFASNKKDNDISHEYASVVSKNTYPLWYFPTPVDDMLDLLINHADTKAGGIKPFIISEIGCGGIYGCHSMGMDIWSEESQVDILTRQITPILEREGVSGVYIWQFCDCKVTDGWLANWTMKRPRSYNNKGMVDEYRREKLAYYRVKEIFSKYSNYFD